MPDADGGEIPARAIHVEGRMLKWVIGLVGFLVAIVALPLIVGMFLPREHRAASSVTLQQPPDSVWAVVRSLDRYPDWWPEVATMEPTSADTTAREIWVQRDRGNRALPLEVVEARPPVLMITRIADRSLPVGGQWTYAIESVDGSTTVTVTEEGEVFNPVFRFVARFFIGYHGTIDRYLRALGARFGESVTPVHLN